MSVPARNPRVAVISSNFWPERTGIGQVTTELAEFLSGEGVEVRVATAMPYYPEWRIYESYAGRRYATERLGNITIHRAWHYTKPAPTTFERMLHEATLCCFSVPNMVRALREADAVFVVSPDLALAFVAMIVARAMRVHRVLIVQDVMPEAAIELGMLRNRALITITKHMATWIYKSADAIYTLGEGMRKRIAQMTAAPEKIQIVPNTIDVAELAPGPDQGKPFRDRFVPPDVFAIVHTGNMGEKQDLDLLLRTARLLKNERAIHFYVFGDGAVKEHFLRCLTEWELTNVSHFPFQERAMLAHVLYGADVLLLSQRPEAVDIVVPSKLMTAMGAGAMIVAACPPNSETARILLSSGGGLIVPSSDELALVETILRVKAGKDNVQRHRERVRTFAERNFDRRAIYMPVLTTLHSLTVNRSAS